MKKYILANNLTIILLLFLLSCGQIGEKTGSNKNIKPDTLATSTEESNFLGHWIDIRHNNSDSYEITIEKSGDMYIVKECSGNNKWYTAKYENGNLVGTEEGDITFSNEKNHIYWQGIELMKVDNK
jgi:hypothetical protein